MSSAPALKGFIQHLEETSFFLELKGANPFRIRALKNAPESLAQLDDEEFKTRIEGQKLTEIKGIGKGIASMAESYVKKQSSDEYQEAKDELPESLLELKDLRGLGPKKIKLLYEGLGTASLGELEYACNENRLVSLKGFGAKTQEKILKEIELLKNSRGKFLLPDALELAAKYESKFQKNFKIARVGGLGRMSEVVESIDFVLLEKNKQPSKEDAFIQQLRKEKRLQKSGSALAPVEFKNKDEIQFYFYFVDSPSEWICTQVFLTSSKPHWKSLQKAAKTTQLELKEDALLKTKKKMKLESDSALYKALGLAYFPPESREFAATKKSPELVTRKDLTGAFHAHSTYSDGANSLKEMAEAAAKQGWSYLGISEHSQSSFYAQGLKEEELKKQWAEIDQLNKGYKNFEILKGIESDILKDGKLDYPKKLLEKFDFVIASIHQRYGMKDMTERIFKAIQNPMTHMIGHWSGRLLLSRGAYELDKERLVREAIAAGVAIELNSHPHRLDMDWRDLHQACKDGLIISVNPDAHSVEGFDDVQYGVAMARKALVDKKNILNTWELSKVREFLCQRRSA